MIRTAILGFTACLLAGCGSAGGDPIVIKANTIDAGFFSSTASMVVKNTGSSGTQYRYSIADSGGSKIFCSGMGYLDAGEERQVTFDCSDITHYSGKAVWVAEAV